MKLESYKRRWLAERTDEQIQRETPKYEDTQFEREIERATERDKNREEDKHSGKSEKDKGAGYQMGKTGTQELEWSL